MTVMLVRLFLAALFGAFVGLEREIHGRAAGLRTHILVALGSALFMITSLLVGASYGHLGDVDPSRIAAGVVTGIGFLGAGAIIRFGASIRGLTTAASIWAVAAIGLAVGTGLYVAAGFTTFLVVAVLFLSRLEERMELKRTGNKLVVLVESSRKDMINDIQNIVEAYKGRVKRVSSEETEAGEMAEVVFDIILARVYEKEIVEDISSLPGVEKVSWKK
ncbi:MAG: MgtC/SapB family protein [Candidatus Omnitrophota bacterium]